MGRSRGVVPNRPSDHILDFDLFVIGGGSAGVWCARIAAEHGKKVGVKEERFCGGICVNIGCIPKKFMVMAAGHGMTADDASGLGWYLVKGEHKRPKLLAATHKEVDRLKSIYKRLLCHSGAETFETHARFIDQHTLDVGGQRISAARIAIATGGHPMRLDIPGAEVGIVSDDAFYLAERPTRIAIIGNLCRCVGLRRICELDWLKR